MLWKVTVFLRPRYAHIFAFVIWQTVALKMNQTGGKAPSTPRLSEYATNALEKIRKELRMFSIGDVHNISNSINGQTHITSHNSLIPNQVECDLNALITHLVATGYTEEQAIAFIKSNGRSELPGEWKTIVWLLYRRLCCRFFCLFLFCVGFATIGREPMPLRSHIQHFGFFLAWSFFYPRHCRVVSPQPLVPPQQLPPKLFRKPSIEREIPQYQQRGSGMEDTVHFQTLERNQSHVFATEQIFQSVHASTIFLAFQFWPYHTFYRSTRYYLIKSLVYPHIRFGRWKLTVQLNHWLSNNIWSWIM